MNNFTRHLMQNAGQLFIALVLMLAIPSCQSKQYTHPTVMIKTTYGKIYVELYPQKAPKTVASFLAFVDSGVFKPSTFYRVLKAEDQPSSSFKSELIQGGIYGTKPGMLASRKAVPLETTKQTGLLHVDGAISLARTTPNSGSTEFFICVGNQPAYDYGGDASSDGHGYAVFGKVIKGMDVVREIHGAPSYGDQFQPPIPIKNIIKISDGLETSNH